MSATHTFLQSISNELMQQIGRLNNFTSHAPSIGTYHETIIRDFLSQYLPSSVSVNTGFIYHPNYGTSPQLDIIIWNSANYAPIFKSAELVVVRPDSVIAVIEVKTKLNKSNIRSAFSNLLAVDSLGRNNSKLIWTILLSFDGSYKSYANQLIAAKDLKGLTCPQLTVVIDKFLLSYSHKKSGHIFLMGQGINNFARKDVLPYFYATLINLIGREFPAGTKPLYSGNQLEELFDFTDKYWANKIIIPGDKIITDSSTKSDITSE